MHLGIVRHSDEVRHFPNPIGDARLPWPGHGKRLKALIPMLVDAAERHGYLSLDPMVKHKLLSASVATIDQALHQA